MAQCLVTEPVCSLHDQAYSAKRLQERYQISAPRRIQVFGILSIPVRGAEKGDQYSVYLSLAVKSRQVHFDSNSLLHTLLNKTLSSDVS